MAVWNEIPLAQVKAAERLDAEFFRPDYVEYERAIERHNYVRLGNVTMTIQRGVQPQYDEDGQIPVIRTVNVRELELSGARQEFVSDEFLRTNPRGKVTAGDILVTSTGIGTLGRVGYLIDGMYFADGHIAYLRNIRDIHPLYVSTFLQTRIGHALIEKRQRGSSGQMEVYPFDLATIPIPRFDGIEHRVVELCQSALATVRHGTACYAEAEALLESALGLDKLDLTPRLFYERPYADVQTAARFDAEYFQPPKKAVLDALGKMPGQPLRDQFRSIRQLWQPDRASAADHVRNYDLTDALQPFLDETVEPATRDTIASTKKKLKPGDLVVSRLRSYLKEIAVVLDSGSVPLVGSTEFIVLRPQKGATRVEALLVYLRSRYAQTVLKWCQDGSNHPRFHEDELLNLRVPEVVRDNQDAIAAKVEASIDARREARRLLDEAKAMVEKAILGE